MKQDFPLFNNFPELVFLDSAASSQKPHSVIESVKHFYEHDYANIHRGIYDLSQKATNLFEEARKKVAAFIKAKHAEEIIFTAGTTEAINLVAFGFIKKYLQKEDVIVLTEMEHHSNIVPWQKLAEETGAEIVYLPITKEGRLDFATTKKNIKVVALAHASNVLGTVNPLDEIIAYFRKTAPEAMIVVDAAQTVPHLPIDVQKLDVDFLAFSSHKMLGPSGVGVLYAKKDLHEIMDPFVVGSHIIKKVTKYKTTLTEAPDKFEPGTRNIEGVVGLGAAIDYLNKIGMDHIVNYEKELMAYALEKFKAAEKVTLFGPETTENRLGVFSFAVGNLHAHDVAEVLNRHHIAVRSGHHCAQPLMTCLGVSGTTRASLYLYNTKEDIDMLFAGIELVKKTFKL